MDVKNKFGYKMHNICDCPLPLQRLFKNKCWLPDNEYLSDLIYKNMAITCIGFVNVLKFYRHLQKQI